MPMPYPNALIGGVPGRCMGSEIKLWGWELGWAWSLVLIMWQWTKGMRMGRMGETRS
jgi:hypothetical protein